MQFITNIKNGVELTTKVIFLLNLEDFRMSFIRVLSRERVYGIIGCLRSIDHIVVRHLIKTHVAYRSKFLTLVNTPFAIIFCNTSVYTCSQMIEFYEKSYIKVVRICSYSPSFKSLRETDLNNQDGHRQYGFYRKVKIYSSYISDKKANTSIVQRALDIAWKIESNRLICSSYEKRWRLMRDHLKI